MNNWIDPSIVDEVEQFVNTYEKTSVLGLEPQSIWGAIYRKHHPESKWTTWEYDKKVKTPLDVENLISKGVSVFSTEDGVEKNQDIQEWMNKYYDMPSKWEKPL